MASAQSPQSRVLRGSLRVRLLLAFSVALALFAATQAWQVVRLRRIGAALDVVSHVYLPLTRLTARMDAAAESRHPERLPTLIGDARLLVARAGPPDAEEAAALAAMTRQLNGLEESLGSGPDPDGGDNAPLTDTIGRLSTLVDGRVAVISERAARQHERTLRGTLLLTIVSLAVGAAVLVASTRALKPIHELTLRVRRLAAGEAPGPLTVAGDDEIAVLARAFGQMATAVAERDQELMALSDYLRRVLDQITAAVVVQEGAELRVTNASARRLWGVAPGPETTVPEPVRALAPGRHEVRWPDGRVHDVNVVPFGEQGRLIVGEDVTERGRDRERLQRSERLALIGQMLAQVTHEVRNPLNAISLNAELLRDDLRSAEALALLDQLMAEIRRLEAVTERYLNLTRRSPALGPEDPARLVRGILDLEAPRLRREGVEVELSATEGTLFETDGSVLRQVLLNLLRNAAEANARRVLVTVCHSADALDIEVRDDGNGVDPSVTSRLFSPFATTRARGTGLGLAVSRQLVEDLGGSLVHVEGAAAGATFRVSLPRVDRPEAV